MNWTGTAAVVVANDSIYVSLTLANESGGTTGMMGRGVLRSDGEFRLSTGRGDSYHELKGRLRDGELYADWTDRAGA